MNRVVVTGIGVVSPIGSTCEKFWSGLVEARSGIGPIVENSDRTSEHPDCGRGSRFRSGAAFRAEAGRACSTASRSSPWSLRAPRCRMRNWRSPKSIALQAATIVGNGAGGMNTLDESYYRLYAQNAARAHPLSIPALMANAACSQVSMDLGLKGPTFTIASACASGTHAIGQAFQMVQTRAGAGRARRRHRSLLDRRHVQGLGGVARAQHRHLPRRSRRNAQRTGARRRRGDVRAWRRASAPWRAAPRSMPS